MGATYDDKVVRDHELHTHRQHWTTIVLEKQDDGQWLATQGSVAVAGHGELRPTRPPSTAGKSRRQAMSKARQSTLCIEYRCRACAHAFTDPLASVTACPRCDSIDNHEQLDHGLE